MLRGSLGPCAAQRQSVQSETHFVGAGAVMGSFRVGGSKLIAKPRASPLVDDHIAGNGEEPGPCRPLAVVRHLGVLPCAEQRLLHDVLGTGLVTGKPHGIAPQRRGMLVVEPPHQRGLLIFHYQPPYLTRGWLASGSVLCARTNRLAAYIGARRPGVTDTELFGENSRSVFGCRHGV